MRLLALDISTSAGWAVFNDAQLSHFGRIELPKTIREYGDYPWNYLTGTSEMARNLVELAVRERPDVIVVEETNLGRNRYSQKVLEFIHCCVLQELKAHVVATVIYISSSAWRRALSIGLSTDDKRNNAKLSRAKSQAKRAGHELDKAALGVKGRINKKHVAVRHVNEVYGLQLKMKDNDVADAICLGAAYLTGKVTPCDGVMG